MLTYFISLIVGVWLYMSAIFIIGIIKKDNTVVDVAWGIGFIGIAWYTGLYTNLFLPRHILMLALVTFWGLRLSLHLYTRNRGRGEDPRYAAWRLAWGPDVIWRSYLQIYMIQAFAMLIIAAPLIVVLLSIDQSLKVFDFVGIALFSIGFLFESVGDYQLKQFIANPLYRGQVMDKGLWRYTRHPNYFGESLMWWGMWIIALSVPYGLLALISPVFITLLLIFVSGVPLTEAQFDNNPLYQEYKKRTSAFFPWLPRAR